MPDPQGTYDFGSLGRVKGLKINGRYATEDQARQYLMKNRMQLMTQDEMRDMGVPHDAEAVTGFVNRATGLVGSVLPPELLTDPAAGLAHSGLNPANLAVNLVRSEKKLGAQTHRQAVAGDPRGIVSALAMLDPFATQSVADINEMRDQGREGEARGTGIFDIFTLLPGLRIKQLGREQPFTPQVEHLTRALEDVKSDPADISLVANELNETARSKGRPNTPASLKTTITEAKQALNNKFNQLLHPIRNRPVIPIQIASELMAESRKPNLLMTPEGRATIAKLRNAALLYQHPWTLEALNEERMTVSARRQSYYGKTMEKQGAQMRSHIDEKIDSIVENGLKDLVYDTMEKQYPNENIRELKNKQSALITLESEADASSKTLRTQQAVHRGSSLLERAGGHGYAHPSGRVGLSFRLQRMLSGGPEKSASGAIKSAFPSPVRRAARVAGKVVGRSIQLAPKDRRKSLQAQLAIAERVKDRAWTARIRKLLEGEE